MIKSEIRVVLNNEKFNERVMAAVAGVKNEVTELIDRLFAEATPLQKNSSNSPEPPEPPGNQGNQGNQGNLGGLGELPQ